MRKYFQEYKLLLSSPLFGLGLSILLYLSDKINQTIGIIIIVCSLIIPLFYILYRELIIARQQIISIRSIIRTFDSVCLIQNEDGDTSINIRYKLTNKSNKSISYMESQYLTSEGKDISFDGPNVINSYPKNTKLFKRFDLKYREPIDYAGVIKDEIKLQFALKIEPSLSNPNDFVEYEMNYKCEKQMSSAFNKEGIVDGVFVSYLNEYIKTSYLSPVNYRFIIMDYWVEDFNGHRSSNNNSKPELLKNESELTWHVVRPLINHKYLCKFRVEKK